MITAAFDVTVLSFKAGLRYQERIIVMENIKWDKPWNISSKCFQGSLLAVIND